MHRMDRLRKTIEHINCPVPYGPWERTPRWMFWKKKWRHANQGPWHYPDEFWEYADDLEVAKWFLEAQCK